MIVVMQNASFLSHFARNDGLTLWPSLAELALVTAPPPQLSSLYSAPFSVANSEARLTFCETLDSADPTSKKTRGANHRFVPRISREEWLESREGSLRAGLLKAEDCFGCQALRMCSTFPSARTA